MINGQLRDQHSEYRDRCLAFTLWVRVKPNGKFMAVDI